MRVLIMMIIIIMPEEEEEESIHPIAKLSQEDVAIKCSTWVVVRNCNDKRSSRNSSRMEMEIPRLRQ